MGSRTPFTMASTFEIIAIVAAGGAVGYLLWRRTQPAEESECDKLCKLAPPPYHDACVAACNILGQIPNPFHDGEQQYTDEQGGRQTTNTNANGARDIALPGSGDTIDFAQQYPKAFALLGLGTMRFANGCEPFYAAPGWSKCAPGSQDMYAMAIDAATPDTEYGYNEANAMVEAPGLTVASRASRGLVHLNKDNFATGASGDPLTQGPAGSGATLTWYVRGVKVVLPNDKVPRAIAIQVRGPTASGQTQATVDAKIRALSDAAAAEGIDPSSVQGSATTTHIDCSNAADNNMTWDTSSGGFWRRLKVGETKRNLPPECSGTTTTKAGFGTLLGSIHL